MKRKTILDAYPASLRTPIRLSEESQDFAEVVAEIDAAYERKLAELADWFELDLSEPEDLLRMVKGLATAFLPGFQLEPRRGRPRSEIGDKELVAAVAARTSEKVSERKAIADIHRMQLFPSHSQEALRMLHQRAKQRLAQMSGAPGT